MYYTETQFKDLFCGDQNVPETFSEITPRKWAPSEKAAFSKVASPWGQ